MGWSTREVADLAGTTVNTVRHYHRSGLLEEPDRMSNGYKQYGARHLVRLLQIRRLRDLGVPLAQVEAVGFAGGGSPAQALLAIDADLEVTIERLQRARGEIRAILQGSTATDVPAGFEDIAGRLSAPERSLMLVYSQLYDASAMSDLKQMVESDPEDADAEFGALPPDADDATRQRLAETLAPQIAQHLSDYPWLTQPDEHLSKSPRVTRETFLETVTELYNEAQLDVLGRASALAAERVGEGAAPAGAAGAVPAADPTDAAPGQGDHDGG
jgi:DNA-binding transcriptional MerR regulator